MASLFLTVPYSSDTELDTIKPTPEALSLHNPSPDLIYGLHGKNTSKAAALNMAYMRANANGEVSAGRKFFYLVDLALETPEAFDDKVLLQLLSVDMMDKVPFLNTKRMHLGCSEILGQMWYEWAKELHGDRRVDRAKVDWNDYMSYTTAFPELVPKLFDEYPKLRCVIHPILAQAPDNSWNTIWVGTTLKAKASSWIRDAEVRMKPSVKVDLSFT